jgi:uncharacterized membrane protein YkvA (DUF1232 family)
MSASQDIAVSPASLPAPQSLETADNEAVVRDGFWRKLRRVAGKVPFAEDAVAAYFCAFDPDVPFRVRATLLGALVYFILPADALPDFLPLLGFTDDASVIVAALAAVGTHMGEKHRKAARQALLRLPDAAE